MGHPCSVNPEMWFGYADDDSGDGAAKARAYEQSATEARLQCLRRCPLAQQRLCARYAVENNEEYGVWAGVKLPGGQYRKREQLAEAHATLRRIAAPADSRLIAALRPYSDITQPSGVFWVYTFPSRFSCGSRTVVYTILYTF